MAARTATPPEVDRIETELLMLARWLEALQRRQRYPMDRAAYLLLRRLDEQGPQSVAALAAGLGLDGSTVTRQLAVLDDAGHVRRSAHPDDGRVVVVEATAAGRRAMTALRAHRQGRIEKLFGDWPAADRAELADVLGRLNTVLRAAAITS